VDGDPLPLPFAAELADDVADDWDDLCEAVELTVPPDERDGIDESELKEGAYVI
jgi:hypothetical protein